MVVIVLCWVVLCRVVFFCDTLCCVENVVLCCVCCVHFGCVAEILLCCVVLRKVVLVE